MSTLAPPKKHPSAHADGWHRADIVAALRKSGWTLRRLSQHYDYHPTTLANALQRPWPKAERLIAEAIGIRPEQIWPERYAARAQGRGAKAAGARRPSRSPKA